MIKLNHNRGLSQQVKQYLVVTGNYWAFTLTDGALRMLVVLYFHQLGYQPLAIAMLFLFYEVFGVVTNLVGGWLGARIGLNKTMNIGLILQVIALLMLSIPSPMLTVYWVMLAQALSGIAKDLNKMSAKSSIKALVTGDQQSTLFRWVAILTGSKNALKGFGFFLGGILLKLFGFQQAVFIMAAALLLVVLASLILLKGDVGKAKSKPKFRQIFSTSASLNYLAAARLFLFAARDVWFVVALPVYLISTFSWSQHYVGSFMACWVIGYGLVQSATPKFISVGSTVHQGRLLAKLAILLAIVTSVIVVALHYNVAIVAFVVGGLLCFGFVFAVNSSLHSFVIVEMAKNDGVSMDVGFYYMANAMGRLLGTVLSGWLYQYHGLIACLLFSSMLTLCSAYYIRKI